MTEVVYLVMLLILWFYLFRNPLSGEESEYWLTYSAGGLLQGFVGIRLTTTIRIRASFVDPLHSCLAIWTPISTLLTIKDVANTTVPSVGLQSRASPMMLLWMAELTSPPNFWTLHFHCRHTTLLWDPLAICPKVQHGLAPWTKAVRVLTMSQICPFEVFCARGFSVALY